MTFNIQSDAAYFVHSIAKCWKCHEGTPVIGLYCHTGTVDGEIARGFAISEIEAIDVTLERHITAIPCMRFAYSRTAEVRYLANHCKHCNMIQGDFHLHSEPGGAFFPETFEAELVIRFEPISGAIAAQGSPVFGVLSDVFKSQGHPRRV